MNASRPASAGRQADKDLYVPSGIRPFCFGEWSFSSRDSYEWPPKGWRDGARRSIEIARSDRNVCVLQGSGTRVQLLVWITGWSNSYWTSGKEKVFLLLLMDRERILNNLLYKNDLSQGSGPSQLRPSGKFRAFYDQSPTAFEPGRWKTSFLSLKKMPVAAMLLLLIARLQGCTINKDESTCVNGFQIFYFMPGHS